MLSKKQERAELIASILKRIQNDSNRTHLSSFEVVVSDLLEVRAIINKITPEERKAARRLLKQTLKAMKDQR